jgi:hypothetical protein
LSNLPRVAARRAELIRRISWLREVVARAVSDGDCVLKGLGEPKRAAVQELSPDLKILNVPAASPSKLISNPDLDLMT